MNVRNIFKSSRVIAATLALFVGGASAAMMPQSANDALKDRIAPIGQVKIAGAAAAAQAGGAAAARSGEAVYNQFCMACHTSGVLGAPKINDAADWEPRLAQGMDTVLKHAIEGFNAMPARGTCSNCSDEEIQAAIDYMIAEL